MSTVEGTALQVEENVVLAPYTTLGVGGPARWFVTVRSDKQLAEAVRFAQARSLRIFVLGGGSNLLVSDRGFNGLVIHVAMTGIVCANALEDGDVPVTVGAGENWDELVQYTVDQGLQGMECLAGIPGTVGGTPVQNVGAYGQEVAQTLVSARCFDTKSNAFVDLSHADFGFAYRTSLLNSSERGRYIIREVTFVLKPGGPPALVFPELKRAFEGREAPTLAAVAEKVRSIRRGKGMVVDAADPDSRSAGSFFRNPIVANAALVRVAEAAGVPADQVPHWPAGEGLTKFAAAWLVERAGFARGYTLGRAGISGKHTLALVNKGDATEQDIAALRSEIVARVEEKFGLLLEQEPVNVG